MSPAERRALLLLLTLAVAGQAVRYLLTRPGEPPGQVQLLAGYTPASPVSQRNKAMQLARPLAPGERIDVDAATAGELARLPKVGPRLAKTIVTYRDAHGPFRELAGLDRVPGIGPVLLQAIAPHLRFSGPAGAGDNGGRAVDSSQLLSPCRGTSALLANCPAASSVPVAPVNINSASLADLDGLPGIGPARAAAIIRYREEQGPFRSVADLAGVPGLGPAAVDRLRSWVVAP
jgi:competence protein ComEA